MKQNIKEKVLKEIDKVAFDEQVYYVDDMIDAIDLTLAEVGKVIDEAKIIKSEICQCGCSKNSHMPHQLDKHGGRCLVCVNCPIYTWKSFEFVDLEELKQKLGIK